MAMTSRYPQPFLQIALLQFHGFAIPDQPLVLATTKCFSCMGMAVTNSSTSSKDQCADLFTKCEEKSLFLKFRAKLLNHT
eukprot:scaffold5611_cov132-Isochrysis_galbana.AAC.11